MDHQNLSTLLESRLAWFVMSFISLCFLVGLYLWFKVLFIDKKAKPTVQLEGLQTTWLQVVALIFVCFYGPLCLQKALLPLLKSFCLVEKTLLLAFFNEIGLCSILSTLLYFYAKNYRKWTFQKQGRWHLIQNVFFTYCKILPLLGAISIIWTQLLQFLVDHHWPIKIDNQAIVTLLSQGNIPLWLLIAIGICIIVLAPICEEIIFRGILFRFLIARYSLTFALWTSAFFFALMHMHVTSFLPLLCLGYFLAKIYVETGDIKTNIGLHMLFNSLNYCLILCLKNG